MKKVMGWVVLTVCLFMLGCSSVPKRMGALPDKKYEVIGRGKESAGGFMLLQFIPIMHNNKIERAYEAAVKQCSGDDLINLTISERWFWAYIGNGYRTTIEGDVIKYLDDPIDKPREGMNDEK